MNGEPSDEVKARYAIPENMEGSSKYYREIAIKPLTFPELTMEDMIVRFDGFGKIDLTRSHEIVADKTYDNKKLNRQKLKELIEKDDAVLFWLEESLKYALRYYDSVRNSGASDVVTMTCCESFEELWTTNNQGVYNEG